MKKIIEYTFLISLFCFSFFYTDKAVTVVKNLDPIIIEINDKLNLYEKNSIDAVIKEDEVIPGMNGCKIDINKSYYNMKKINTYSSKLLVFDQIKPNISISNIYDKYIIKGNTKEKNISIVIDVDNTSNIDFLLDYIKNKNIKVNFFIDGSILEDNLIYINKMKKNNEIYNGGYNLKYERNYLVVTNNLINDITNNTSKYCITLEKNKDILNLCSSNRMYTIKPNVIINSNNYILEKNSIDKGSIVYFNSNYIETITNTINYLIKKGYNFVLLSELLSENNC